MKKLFNIIEHIDVNDFLERNFILIIYYIKEIFLFT